MRVSSALEPASGPQLSSEAIQLRNTNTFLQSRPPPGSVESLESVLAYTLYLNQTGSALARAFLVWRERVLMSRLTPSNQTRYFPC